MTQSWFILRLKEHDKERYVEAAINRIEGWSAWTPMEVRMARISPRHKARREFENALLPKRLFAAFPAHLQPEVLRIRYVDSIERGSDFLPLLVPSRQLDLFRSTIADMNARIRALKTATTKKDKARWKSMKEALEALINEAKEEKEMAA